MLLKFGVVTVACNRGSYIKRVPLWYHSLSFDMKTVRKPRDFSIEGILADTFMFLHNDHCKNTLQTTITQNYQVTFPNWDNCVRNPKPILQTGTGSEFKSAQNNFDLVKRNFTVNGKSNIEIATEDVSIVGELDRNDKSYIAANVGEEGAVHIKSKNSEQESLEKYNKNAANLEGNINHRNDISNDNGKRNSDTIIIYRRICEGRNKKEHKNCTKLFLGNQCNLNKIIASDVVRHTKEEMGINDPKLNFEEVSVNYDNINTNKRQTHLNNVQEGNNKNYLKTGQRGNIKQNQGTDEESRHEGRKTFEEKEMDLLLIDNQQGDSIKFCKDKSDSHQIIQNTAKLEWLNYTRYKPPKVSRKSMTANSKRKRSIHPRIPFTTFQLEFLEQKFRKSAYLSKDDVSKISDILHLPSHRVKIWFQNRRAREKRTNE